MNKCIYGTCHTISAIQGLARIYPKMGEWISLFGLVMGKTYKIHIDLSQHLQTHISLWITHFFPQPSLPSARTSQSLSSPWARGTERQIIRNLWAECGNKTRGVNLQCLSTKRELPTPTDASESCYLTDHISESVDLFCPCHSEVSLRQKLVLGYICIFILCIRGKINNFLSPASGFFENIFNDLFKMIKTVTLIFYSCFKRDWEKVNFQ